MDDDAIEIPDRAVRHDRAPHRHDNSHHHHPPPRCPGPGLPTSLRGPVPPRPTFRRWTEDLPARLKDHSCGRGARLMEVITAAGIGFALARTWPGSRALERRLKRRGGHARLCPICRAAQPKGSAPRNQGPVR
jgi:hypothetical protein